MKQTCFVIMPIGDQKIGNKIIKKGDFKSKYTDLIKEAILKANPNLDVIRADEIALMGSVTTDIISRIMFSEYIIADITYPNPNVFYELGLRHACRNKTILIMEKTKQSLPFDISHLRYIEYENTIKGLKELSEKLKEVFDSYIQTPGLIDNHFLDFARIISFPYPQFSNVKEENKNSNMVELMSDLMQYDDFFDFMTRMVSENKDSNQLGLELIKYMISKGGNQELLKKLFAASLLNQK
jgi:hypothetical protein